MSMLGLKWLAARSKLRCQRGTEAAAVAGIKGDRLNRLISHADARQSGYIILAIVRVVNDFVVTLREALEPAPASTLRPDSNVIWS